jgi:hypothetical protein
MDWYEEWTGTESGLVRRMDWYEEWPGTESGLVRRMDSTRLIQLLCYFSYLSGNPAANYTHRVHFEGIPRPSIQ